MLIIKLTLDSIGTKAATITLKDETGAYNVSTNPGGYGSTNELLSPATTTKAYILWRYWTDEAYSTAFSLTGQNITDIQSTGLSLTPVALGLSTDSTDVFADGIHQVKYLPAQLLPNSATGTFTPGSKIVPLTNGLNIANLLNAGALTWIGVVDGSVTKFYEVDASGTNNNTQITMKTAFSGAAPVVGAGIAAAEGDLKVLIATAAEACIVSSTGKLADIPGDCTAVEVILNKLIRWKFAAGILKDCQDYDGAHNMVVSINKYCASGKCICTV